jgi:bifunctional DNA-binding transcriptional regulator/antitoxin component of YhaV-PrlF toxin-antitoxin module
MIDFELKDEWDGWSGIAIPDDMNVQLQTADTTHEMQISLMKLLELYGYTVHQKPCVLTVGTGSSIEIVDENDHIWLKKYPLKIRTTFEDLQESLEPLLRQVFIKKDEQEGANEREDSISYAQKKVQESDVEYDVNELYQRLTEM